MSKRSKYTAQEKLRIIHKLLDKNNTLTALTAKYDICSETIYKWMRRYEVYGVKGLTQSKTNKKYSKELKCQAVKDYLSGNFTYEDICLKYDISAHRTIQLWIKKYNSHIELKDTQGGSKTIMTKGRKTTVKERIEITENCIANNLDYNKTALKYKVSYQQVYAWVKKYKDAGPESLMDKRGKRKSENTLTAEELMELKIKKLQAENERLRAENLLLKKLEELERRGY